jgi:hypothetical protein
MIMPNSHRLTRAGLTAFAVLSLLTGCAEGIRIPAPRPAATWAATIVASPTQTPGTPPPSPTATPRPTLTPTATPRPTPIPTPTPAPLPAAKGGAGWTNLKKPALGFQISLPPGWKDVSYDSRTWQATMGALTESNPELTTLLSTFLAGGGVLYGFDTATTRISTTLPTGVIVSRQPVGTIRSLDLLTALVLSMAGVADTVEQPVAHRRVALNAGVAEEITLRLTAKLPETGAPIELFQTHYLMLIDDTFHALSFTTTADEAQEMLPVFHRIAQSYTLAK